jgi:transformation/transcription domain-associated protein
MAYDAGVITFVNTVEALTVTCQQRPDDWTAVNVAILQQIVDKALSSADYRVHIAVRPLLERIFAVLPPPAATDEEAAMQVTQPEATRAFFDWATSTAEEGLRPLQPNLHMLHGTVILLDAWVKNSTASIEFSIVSLVRVLTRLTKDHVNAPMPIANDDTSLRMLTAILDLLRPRISQLGEQRRWVLSALVQLVEKSSNIDLLRFVLDMTRRWVLDKVEAFPTIKEKAGLLQKMLQFEKRPGSEELVREFLQLILDVYSDAHFARSELTVRLENAFLLGCKNRDATIRGNFLKVFDESISRQLFGRMHYIIGVQNWEQLAESNWIHQALDLLCGAIDADDQLYVDPDTTSSVVKQEFVAELGSYRMGGLVDAARKLLYADATVTHVVWTSTFSAAWSCLSKREQADMTRFLTALVSKDYQMQSLDRRPNNVQALLNGLLACSPVPAMPPHLVRYLGKTFGVWHTSLEMLSDTLDSFRDDDETRESTLDAMAEMYGDLAEDDLFYGLWRRRCASFFTPCECDK